MQLDVIGCHGGETTTHRLSSFLIDGHLALDAGAITSGLTLAEQGALRAVILSHAHLDHVRDLAMLADNRCQLGCEPLIIAASAETIQALSTHFYNNVLWPDFSTIPSGTGTTVRYLPLPEEVPTDVAGARITLVGVNHSPGACAVIIQKDSGSIAYSGDTGPTDRLWKVLDATPNLLALLMEVSFPESELTLAMTSQHHTPQTMATDLGKLPKIGQIPIYLFHMKPVYKEQIEKECAALTGLQLHVMNIGDQYTF